MLVVRSNPGASERRHDDRSGQKIVERIRFDDYGCVNVRRVPGDKEPNRSATASGSKLFDDVFDDLPRRGAVDRAKRQNTVMNALKEHNGHQEEIVGVL